jgi:hypothetical protein
MVNQADQYGTAIARQGTLWDPQSFESLEMQLQYERRISVKTSQEVTIMTLSTLFEKQVFVRLTEDHTAFICTTKWPFLSKIRRVSVDEAGRNLAPQAGAPGSMAPEEVPPRSSRGDFTDVTCMPIRRNAV